MCSFKAARVLREQIVLLLTGFVLIVPGPFERNGNTRAAKRAR